MARIVGDVEVLGVGVREFTIETWDTLLFSLSFIVAMLLIDARLTLAALAPGAAGHAAGPRHRALGRQPHHSGRARRAPI